MGLRTCTVCSRSLPEAAFYRNARGKDGRQSACKDCHRERVREYRARVRQRNRQNPPTIGSKRCGRCGVVRPAAEFHRNRSTPDGLHWVCADCSRVPAQKRREVEQRRTIRDYGITREEFEALRQEQGGACAICRRDFDKTPHIDHDHETGLVRGLLCRECNLGLGLFGDDVARLRAAIEYLEQEYPAVA